MKRIISSVLLMLLIGFSSLAFATPVVSNEQELTPANYAATLKSINLDDTPQLASLRDFWVSYYSKVHIVKTIRCNGYVVDCVPFNQQPALINADSNTIEAAKQADNSNSGSPSLNGVDFDRNQCPAGTVAIVRPQLKNFQQKRVSAFTKNDQASKPKWKYYYVNLAGGTNSFIPVDYASTNNVWIGLGGNTDPGMSQNQSGHALNQLWWLTAPGLVSGVNSLETGWIESDYFTSGTNMQTTIFAFSTPDGYAKNGPPDVYNTAGGFIQFSKSSVVLGTPISNISFVFSYVKTAVGYELDLYPINSNGSIGTKVRVGYYPYSRYQNGNNEQFTFLGGGAEICIQVGAGSTDGISGTMYGIGTNFTGSLANSWPLNMHADSPYSFTTQTFNGNPSVVFSGSNTSSEN